MRTASFKTDTSFFSSSITERLLICSEIVT
nr:MAG TPA: hypothetical protein [Caudoviricetes sp.]